MSSFLDNLLEGGNSVQDVFRCDTGQAYRHGSLYGCYDLFTGLSVQNGIFNGIYAFTFSGAISTTDMSQEMM